MNVLCVIDHFGSGGSQKQMVELACGLKRRRHTVEVFVYHPKYDFFKATLSALAICVHEYDKRSKGFAIGVVNQLRSLFKNNKYDVVISFLQSPSVYCELTKLTAPSTKLIVSERASHFGDRSRLGALFRRHLHRCANHIVVNSHSHKSWLENNHKWLRGKVTTIYNGLDVSQFASPPLVLKSARDLRLIAVGRVGPEKNVLRLLMALDVFYRVNGWLPTVSWVGRRDDDSTSARRYCRQVDHWLDDKPQICKHWRWVGERADIPNLIAGHHALIHPSEYEGLPNVVCEALAAGRPVLVSDVCDHARLVASGERGFLFDPRDPADIADAIGRLAALGERDWIAFSGNARRYAQAALTTERMVSEYEALFLSVIGESSRGFHRSSVCAASPE